MQTHIAPPSVYASQTDARFPVFAVCLRAEQLYSQWHCRTVMAEKMWLSMVSQDAG